MDDASALLLRQIQTDHLELRRHQAAQDQSVSKLWAAHRELAVVVHGAQGDNGIRSDVRALEVWRAQKEQDDEALSSKLQHYLDIEREETCHGMRALEAHRKDHNEIEQEETEVKVAKIGATRDAWVQLLTLVGVLATAIIAAVR